jgi:hypothetical protein
MGHAAPRAVWHRTHLEVVTTQYLRGDFDIEELERRIAGLLASGRGDLVVQPSPPPKPPELANRRAL